MTRELSKTQRTEQYVWLCVLVFASCIADQYEIVRVLYVYYGKKPEDSSSDRYNPAANENLK